ncbi:vomeronasal type-2 receptor 26-like [Ranitomeya imitator]|uniref:vomeronasal type-2 receptor 26-like n=1 Tax=Ranitomeya imitator TaxID=111125 RepID=UPI0037E7FB92
MSIPLMRLLMQSLTHIKEQASAAEEERSLNYIQPLSAQGTLLDEVADKEVEKEEDGDENLWERDASQGAIETGGIASFRKRAEKKAEIADRHCGILMPKGRCSQQCLPGTRKILREGFHICCYDCIPCPEGEFANSSESENCQRCPDHEWPNKEKNKCVFRDYEFVSYETDVLASVFSIISILLSFITVLVIGIFTLFWKSPIVRANNRNLSFILLISLLFSVLCVFLFIGCPLDITCMLRQVFFGILFTVAESSILAKTIIVCIAFKATRPGSPWRKCVGVRLPYSVVLVCSSLQIGNAVIWLSVSPPYQEFNLDYPGKIIIQCNEGSLLAFSFMLGYMGFLAAVSFFLAFMVRTLPDIYNEAKYITFSMLVFCSVWICAIPAYLSSTGKHMVTVEIFAILASVGAILSCIFFPKCYNIFMMGEKGRKRNIIQK